MGGENWETRWVRSRASLLRSPRDLHLDLATFGARPSLRNFDALLALLGTALATAWPFQGSFGGIRPSVASAVPRSPKSGAKILRDGRAPKVARSKCKSRGDRSKPLDFFPTASPSSHHTPSSRDRSIYRPLGENLKIGLLSSVRL